MVFQAFIDESYTENSTFVLAGYVASESAWADFSREWEALLPILPAISRGQSGKLRFKMSELQHHADRVRPFHQVIEDHVLLRMSCKLNLGDLNRAKARIWSDNTTLVWGPPSDPFWTACSMLLTKFHEIRYERQFMVDLFPLNEKVDFYFDAYSGGSDQIAMDWEDYAALAGPEIRELYGAVPRFESDESFVPLQAADFWAWWVRYGYEVGKLDQIIDGDFGAWRASRRTPALVWEISENQMVENLISKIKKGMGIGLLANIYDDNVTPRTGIREIPCIPRMSRSVILTKIEKLLRGHR
jgi:hypothetical protein